MKKFLKVSAIGLSFILMFVMLVACGEGSLPIDNPQQPVDALNNDTYSITYSIAGSDRYLAEQNINNANPEFYTVSQGLVLQNISVPGYNFKGWYTHETGGDRITEIAAGTKGAKELFAQWEEIEYTINFDSPDVPMESKTYKVSTGATLQKPSWFGYTFVGWSIDGKLVNSIPVGTTGNITLHANWTSERNKATAVTQLEDPSVIEDMHNGQYIFIYEIGSIQNVPLALLKDLANSEGIEVVVNEKFQKAVDSNFSTTITDTVANATTKTSSWTLADEWNESTSATNEHDEEIGKSKETVDSEGNTVGGNYYVSNSSGGVTSSSSSQGGSNASSSKVTVNESTGINGSYSNTNNKDASVELNSGTKTVNNKFSNHEWNVNGGLELNYTPKNVEVSAGDASIGIGGGLGGSANIGGSIGGSWGDSEETTKYDDKKIKVSGSDVTSASIAVNRTKNVGTDSSKSSESHWDSSKSASSNWNTMDSYETSSYVSNNLEISNAISQVIYDRYQYSSTQTRGASNALTNSNGATAEKRNEYASTVEYSKEIIATSEQNVTLKSSASGYYRLVMAGTVHVFAVVGYDIATNSYYTYTYSVLDDERHVFLDYSKENPNFNDCENAILPFEIPYFVHEYVSGVVSRSDGLTVDISTGYITEYNPADSSPVNVVIPEYVSVDNGHGSYSAVRIRGIAEGAFRGKTNITGIYFPKYVSEIPANAFEGCTNLRTVVGYGISKIGQNAFKDCTSLDEFVVDEKITVLGKNAFLNAPSVRVNAIKGDVVTGAIESGAKKMVLDVSKIPAADKNFDNQSINIVESFDYFALLSDGRTYNNFQIVSDAKETYLSNMVFAGNSDTPLKINSTTLTLNRVTVQNAPGFALLLNPKEGDHTRIKLYGEVNISSNATDAIVGKSATFEKENPNVAGTLKIKGNYLVCGTAENTNMLSFSGGGIKTIDANTYNSMITSGKVTFELNGGSMNSSAVTVFFGQKYGNLPTPTRANYEFAGWKTASGAQVNADSIVSITGDHVLYASWTPKKFTVSFNAMGGSVSTASKTLTFGDTLGSLPTPTRAYYTFNGWYTSSNGGTKVSASTKPSAAQNMTLYASWTANQFTVTFNANGGSVSTSSKKVTFGQSYGTLPTPTRTHHDFLGWYTAASGGNKVTESTVQSNGNNITLYAHWQIKVYTLTFNANGGSVSTSSKKINAGSAYGTLPTPTKDYNNFLGWYTAASGGSKVSSSTVLNGNVTVYAQWKLKDTQWAKASAVPSGAQVISRKWTYTKTETTESTNASLSGWTQTGSYWKQTGSGSTNYASFPSGFDTSNKYYKDFAKKAYEAYDNGSTKRVVTNTRDGWIYWHWMYNVAYVNGTNRAISSKKGTFSGRAYIYFYAIKSTVDCPKLDKYYCHDQGVMGYNCHSILPKSTSTTDGMGTSRFFRFECNLSSYIDYVKMYQYKKVTNNLESATQISNSDSISNVTEMVQYRPK